MVTMLILKIDINNKYNHCNHIHLREFALVSSLLVRGTFAKLSAMKNCRIQRYNERYSTSHRESRATRNTTCEHTLLHSAAAALPVCESADEFSAVLLKEMLVGESCALE